MTSDHKRPKPAISLESLLLADLKAWTEAKAAITKAQRSEIDPKAAKSGGGGSGVGGEG